MYYTTLLSPLYLQQQSLGQPETQKSAAQSCTTPQYWLNECTTPEKTTIAQNYIPQFLQILAPSSVCQGLFRAAQDCQSTKTALAVNKIRYSGVIVIVLLLVLVSPVWSFVLVAFQYLLLLVQTTQCLFAVAGSLRFSSSEICPRGVFLQLLLGWLQVQVALLYYKLFLLLRKKIYTIHNKNI